MGSEEEAFLANVNSKSNKIQHFPFFRLMSTLHWTTYVSFSKVDDFLSLKMLICKSNIIHCHCLDDSVQQIAKKDSLILNKLPSFIKNWAFPSLKEKKVSFHL